jgi:putative CocE/NonD family hydrolase
MSWIDWIWNNIAPDVRVRKNLPGPRTNEDAAATWKSSGLQMQGVLPLASMSALRDVAPYYYEWLRHPQDDPWWGWADLPGKYGRTSAAVLNLSGWYDDNYGPEGATTNFLGLVAAREGRPTNTALLIGPWVHGVDSTGTARAGERSFADAAKIDYDSVVLDWMDHYVRGLDNGIDRKAPVRYYVMGADTWRDSQAWPPKATARTFYLGRAAAGKPGMLNESPPTATGFSAFVSDPMHPVTNQYVDSGAHDYKYLAARADLLSFDTEPLPRDLEVAGPIDADIYMSCGCKDVDIWVRLYDVAPDGTAWNQMNAGIDVQRASYRDLAKGRQLLRPGQIYEVRVAGPVTANVFRKGHRIRVQVSGSFFPNFSRNLQTGEMEAASAAGMKKAIHIYHDRAHASHVVLPVVD